MLKCKEVATIISKNEKLSFTKKLEFKVHLFMCKHCNNYNNQIKALIEQSKLVFQKKSDVSQSEIEKLEASILDKLKK
jgi:hypothetical protein